MWHVHCNVIRENENSNPFSKEKTMIVPRVATAYDQNPARIALVLRDRRRQSKKSNASVYRAVVSIGLIALYAIHYLPV